MKKINIFLTVLLLSALMLSAQTKWSFDKSHSKIGFTVSHMVITDVDGKFNDYEGTVVTNGDTFEGAQVNFTIQTASIFTDNENRDNHLRSDDFFAADQHPQITFVGKSMTKVSDDKYKLVGDLTMRGTTKEVTLDVKHNGTVQDPWGNTKAGFKLTGSVDRFEYGLNWNKAIEAGGLVVGKTVYIDIDVQLKKETNTES
ncbi:MAG: YceI family protein [Melioribacteraceae bacterium]|jgi:polyisoprenoid-binding protein YceI|nr:YceI family protein [Melioribacteraceae bacterium]WKZ69475.1 MAG: YceI family protein [Melioribacteraceae bacterium]